MRRKDLTAVAREGACPTIAGVFLAEAEPMIFNLEKGLAVGEHDAG